MISRGCASAITRQATPNGSKVYFGPAGPAQTPAVVIPGEGALVLEPHPNQHGISLEAVPGSPEHQVGGLPQWVEIDRHPRCPECGDRMPFLTSLGSGSTPYGPLNFDGILYGFWCDHCSVSTTLAQN